MNRKKAWKMWWKLTVVLSIAIALVYSLFSLPKTEWVIGLRLDLANRWFNLTIAPIWAVAIVFLVSRDDYKVKEREYGNSLPIVVSVGLMGYLLAVSNDTLTGLSIGLVLSVSAGLLFSTLHSLEYGLAYSLMVAVFFGLPYGFIFLLALKPMQLLLKKLTKLASKVVVKLNL